MQKVTFLKFSVIRLKLNGNKCHHQLFAKDSGRSKDVNRPLGKTIIVLNVPPFLNESDVAFLFRRAGDVVSVVFPEKPKPNDDSPFFQKNINFCKYKAAIVVFRLTKHQDKALKLNEVSLCDKDGNLQNVSGVDKWRQEVMKQIHNEEELQLDINKFMEIFDKKREAGADAEDDGGWTTVTKKGRHPGFEQKESVINKVAEKLEQGKKKKHLQNFYTFQIRESKMKEIVSLRQKFQEDKEKVQQMKKTRRFKPY